MPRRYYEYPERFAALNVASTAGASLLAFGFVIIAIYLAISLRHGEVAGRNPWGSTGYEWDTPSPPPTENFDKVLVYDRGPHEYSDIPEGHAKVGHAS
jgi:cytochrome c oxidase subunit 1